jgi:hypothetical protein
VYDSSAASRADKDGLVRWSHGGDTRVTGGRDRLDLRLDLADLLVAAGGFALKGAEDDFVEAHVDEHLAAGRLERFAGPALGQLAGEHLVEDHAE